MIDLYVSIQQFSYIPTKAPANKVNRKIEAHLLAAETKTKNGLNQFKVLHTFLCFSLIKRLSLSEDNLLFNLFFKMKSRLTFYSFSIFISKIAICFFCHALDSH